MPNETAQIELDVCGMTCPSCDQHVSHVLAGVTGVQSVDVPGWQSSRATVVAAPTWKMPRWSMRLLRPAIRLACSPGAAP